MPRPSNPVAIQRPDLAEIAFEAIVSVPEQGFVGQEIFPRTKVENIYGDYPKIPVEALLKSNDTRRAPRGGYNRNDWEFDTGNYVCQEHGYEEVLDDIEARLYQRLFDAESVCVERAALKIYLNYELRIINLVTNPANIVLTDPATAFWNGGSAAPMLDVTAAKMGLRYGSGIAANSIVMSYQAFQALLTTAELVSYLKFTNPPLALGFEEQKKLIASYFGLEQCLVAGGLYDRADKGLAADLANIWPDDIVLVARLALPGDKLGAPCLGKTFLWVKDSPGFLVSELYREPERRSTVYRVRQHTAEEFVFPRAGFLLTAVMS